MGRTWTVWSVVALLVAVAGAETGGGSGASVDDLDWLAGCWQTVDAEAGSGEQWTRPAGGTLLGTGRTVKEGRTVATEHLLIRETDAGIEYVAWPSGQSKTIFGLKSLGDGEVVFENPGHDFPQRIAYRLNSPNRLVASIEGESDGVVRGVDFSFRRVECAEPLGDTGEDGNGGTGAPE